MENGQYGVAPAEGAKAGKPEAAERRQAKGRRQKERDRGREKPREKQEKEKEKEKEVGGAGEARTHRARRKLTMEAALELLNRALDTLLEGDATEVRDSDVKRRMLELRPTFDEGELGFSKFSKFLSSAEENGAIELSRGPNGNYRVSRGKGAGRGRGRHSPVASPTDEKPSAVKRLARFLFGAAEELPSGEPVAEKAPLPKPQPRESKPPAERGEAPRRPRRGGRESRGRPSEARDRSRREARSPRGESAPSRAARPGREEHTPGGRRAGERRPRDESRDTGGQRGRQRSEQPAKPAPERARGESQVTAGVPREDRTRPSPTVPDEVKAPPATPEVGRPESPASAEPAAKKAGAAPAPLPGAPRGTIRGRWGTRGRYRPAQAPPPVFHGQKQDEGARPTPEGVPATPAPPPAPPAGDAGDSRDIVNRLTGYPGVGRKTAESLVEAFGADTLRVLDEEPDRVREVLPGARAERLIAARREERESGGQ